ncbi:MAG TPA: type II toxin-antitoxin system VapC family toxin [Gemmatimonadales bacterium]|nr:type II toxin-antitoxin system VapC family toxin [Gemmatimonadales bacterium]
MRFWDSSAIVSLLVHETASERMDELLEEDRAIVVWWGTMVESYSALARQRRDAALDAAGLQAATSRLRRLATAWLEVPAAEQVREQALRLLRVHALRASDALQLGAALIAAELRPDTLEFVTLDGRQAEGARREGFQLVG